MTPLELKITEFLNDVFGVTVETNDTPLVSDGLIDSMQVLEVAMFLEAEADTTLAETDLVVENFDTVTAMAALVASKG